MKKVILFVFIFHCSLTIANAQWVPVNGPYGANIQCLANSGTNVFAGTYQAGVFLTTNNGTNWLAAGFANQTVYSLASSGIYMFAGTLGGVSRSSNNGTNWTAVYNYPGFIFISLTSNGSSIFAGTDGYGVLRSTNNGDNWTYVNIGLTNGYIHSLLASGTNLFAATNGGVFLSTNNGGTWTAVNNGLTYISVYALAASGINLFAGTWGGGVFVSSVNGGTWTALNNGLSNRDIRALTVSESNTFIANTGGVFLSTSLGSVWINRNQGFSTVPIINCLLVANNYIFAGTESQSIWRRNLSEIITGTGITSQINPDSYSLYQNYPNPFNPSTNIRYTIPKNGLVKLVVFDVLGREVETLVNQTQQAGKYSIDFNASELSGGVYLYKLETNGFSEIKKMILIK